MRSCGPGLAPYSRALAMATSNSWSWGTTWSTSPSRRASAGSSMRPDRARSEAAPQPQRWTRKWELASSGRDAHLHEAAGQLGLLGGHEVVHGQHEREADPDGGAVDGGHHRLGLPAQRHPVGGPVLVGTRLRLRPHFRRSSPDGGPSSWALNWPPMSAPAQKPRPGPGEHDGADAVVVVGVAHRRGHLHRHLAGPGVEPLGPVQGDDGDVVVGLVDDLLERHSPAPSYRPCRPVRPADRPGT